MNYFLFSFNTFFALFLSFLFLFIIPIFIIKYTKKLSIILYLTTYVILLVLGLFTDVNIGKNSIDFNIFIDNKWCASKLTIAYFNPYSVLINLFLLFPLGVILPLLFKNKSKLFIKIVIIGLLSTSLIEFLQFLLPIDRSPEILDIITNTISSILGYIYYIFITRVMIRGVKSDQLSK